MADPTASALDELLCWIENEKPIQPGYLTRAARSELQALRAEVARLREEGQGASDERIFNGAAGWSEAQRAAAFAIACDARVVLDADAKGAAEGHPDIAGDIAGLDAATARFCAEIAKYAHLFVMLSRWDTPTIKELAMLYTQEFAPRDAKFLSEAALRGLVRVRDRCINHAAHHGKRSRDESPRPQGIAGAPREDQRSDLADADRNRGSSGAVAGGPARRGGLIDLDACVERFLAWPLPVTVCADKCASMVGYPGRSGTNLLSAAEARAMFDHCLPFFASRELDDGRTQRDHEGA